MYISQSLTQTWIIMSNGWQNSAQADYVLIIQSNILRVVENFIVSGFNETKTTLKLLIQIIYF